MDPRLAGVLVAGDQVCTTARLRAIEIDADETERLVRSGELVRLRRGLYAAGERWRSAKPEARLALCTRAVLGERPDAAASHASAAVLHGLPLWGVGLSTVEVICSSPRGRLRGGVRLRPWPDGVDVQVVDGLRVVPVGMAIAQVTDEYGFLPGLVCLDGALHTEQVTGPQVEIFDRRGKIGRVDFLVGQAMARVA